ncbi:MAG: hypothetical protein J6R26_07355 [Paludibacteraceae bacterium]|nr:hypothetical protein [Paludibacteraceae bacterium]
MKKILLSVVFAMVAITTTFAAQLNPFAYGLRSELSAGQSTLTVHYSLNSTATSVKVVVMNGNTVVEEKDCSSLGLTKGNYTTTISTTGFPMDTELTWKVVVEGKKVTQPTEIEQNYSFWHPHAVAIDNNPMSSHFGRILVAESDQDIPATGYHSSKKGVGLYAFNAGFEPIENGKVYTGGKNLTRQHNLNGTKGYQPFIVRVSEDSRIFVSSGDARADGTVVWEVNADDLNSWSNLIQGNIVKYTNQANATNGVYLVNNAQGKFLAGVNCSMDVKGSGSNLKLLLYSTDRRGMTWFVPDNYHLHEYVIGDNTTYSGTPTQITHFGSVDYGHSNRHAKVYYDGDYGFWFAGIYSASTNSFKSVPFAHALKTASGYTRKTWGLGDDEFDGGSGVRIHRSKATGEEWVIKGVHNNVSPTTNGKFIIYKVTRNASGTPELSVKYPVVTSSKGKYFNDFAIDYAENLYSVDNNGEKLLAFALPYPGIASTPAASQYAFRITQINYGEADYDQTENLAPFAYDLRSTQEQDGRIKLHFMLNAHAREVKVWLVDEDTKHEYLLRNYPNATSSVQEYVPYHESGYGTIISADDIKNLNLPCGKPLSWRVDVYGKEVTASSYVNSYSFYHPSAVDIDNNPENPNFGMILCNEGLHEVKGKSEYMGYGYGAGLYAFTADFKPIKNGNSPGFNGGFEFTTTRADGTGKAYSPRRIRISEDGRIFVTSLNTDGHYLWEVIPDELNSKNLNKWNAVFSGTLNTKKELVDTEGNFIAAPNNGFDVKGSGENLQLAMYSVNLPGITSTVSSGFRLHEYNLGTATEWTTAPSKAIVEGKYAINYTGTQVEYDNEGGVWIASYRGTANSTNPGLVHINADGVEDAKLVWSNVRQAGIRFNKDFTRLVVAGIKDGSSSSTKKATIYTISKDANGAPVLTEEAVVDMTIVGVDLNDFAWDYAGNLYACGNSGEKLAAYVMPRKATDVVSTPAALKHRVTLTAPVPRIVAYNLTYRPNGASQTYDFSFYANTQPTGGSISFYMNDAHKTHLYTHTINEALIQGDNTVSIPMATLDAALNMEKDITWELTLSAPESMLFGKIYESKTLNTAYATINTNPATDYFGHIYANSQAKHAYPDADMGGGEMFVWEPGSGVLNNTGDRYHTILENRQIIDNGFEQGERLCVAPDGKVYISDNGIRGGIYIMDPKNYSTTSFFNGLTFKEGNTSASSEKSLYYYNSEHVGSPSSCSYIYWPGGDDAKLFATRTEYYPDANVGSHAGHATYYRHNEGYFVYDLKKSNNWQHDWATDARQKVTITLDNLFSTDFAIVGTSHGAWICQHRSEDNDLDESRSLMFFDNNGVRQYCSDNNDVIYGSAGAALAVNKEENLLAMASGTGGIIFFDIKWSNDGVPTLSHKYTSWINDASVVTTLNFDYAGNLVATIGNSYNDRTDQHRVVLYTLPKAENTVTVPARFSQRVAALYADERMDVHFDEDITNASPYQTVDVFRRLQAGMCNTICLPFSLNSLENTPYKNATVFAFTGVSQGNDQVELQFSKVETIQAGVPYLIQPENDITDLLRFSPVQVNANFNNEGLSVTQGSGTNAITFHGAIDPTTLSVNQNYLFLVANNRLATASAGGDMLGMRGYFTVNGVLPAKAVISFKEGVTTGTTSTVTPTTDGVQKVLQNQQILIIRDGETYNILGEHINTK